MLLDRTDHPMLSPATVGTYCQPNRLVIVDYISLIEPVGQVIGFRVGDDAGHLPGVAQGDVGLLAGRC